MKKVFLIILGLAVLIGISVSVFKSKDQKKDVTSTTLEEATYVVEGKRVPLDKVEANDPSGSTTKYFGNGLIGDFNDDGAQDSVFILTQTSSGTGVFYYVALALGFGDGFVGKNTIFLGDRIAPQNTEYKDGMIIVNYADRKPEESFVAAPSVGVSRYFKIENDELKEISALKMEENSVPGY